MPKKIVLFFVPLLLYLGLLGALPLMEPDEARYSLIPAAMNATGNYVTPQIKNTIYLEKPPLACWATAISFKIFGENDFSARLFAALCAWGCIALVYFIGRRWRDEKTGLYAAAVLTISTFHFTLGRINILDMPLTFFMCLSIWLGYLALQEKSKKYLFYLFYLACALTFLTKGLIGLMLPFGILIIWLGWMGRWRDILRLISPVGIIIFAAVVCPWLILAQKENSDFLWFFFVQEHFLRYTTSMHGKGEPFYFYLPVILAGTIPWSFYLIRAYPRRHITGYLFNKEDNRLLAVWFLLILAFYTLSSSKLPTYIAPVFLPLALFAGSVFRHFAECEAAENSRLRSIIYYIALVGQSLLVIVALLAPPLLKKYSDAEKGLVVMISDNWWYLIIPSLVAVLLMTFLPDLIRRRLKQGWFAAVYMLSALFLGGILFPLNDFLAPYRSAHVAKDAIAEYLPAGQDLYQYRINFYGIDFYNKIRTPIVEDFGELGSGIAKLPAVERTRYFLTVDEFVQLSLQKKEIYCITQHQERLKDIKARMPKVDVLWENGAFYLLRITTS